VGAVVGTNSKGVIYEKQHGRSRGLARLRGTGGRNESRMRVSATLPYVRGGKVPERGIAQSSEKEKERGSGRGEHCAVRRDQRTEGTGEPEVQ